MQKNDALTWIRQETKKYRSFVILLTVLEIFVSGLGVCYALVMKQMVDRMVENGMKKHINKDGSVSKVRYVWRRIFPGKEVYQYYPFFNKYKIFLPVFWIYRLFRAVFQKKRRERIRREIVTVKRVK